MKLSHQLSRNGTKYIKHPFFVTDNPAETLYRKLVSQTACKPKPSSSIPRLDGSSTDLSQVYIPTSEQDLSYQGETFFKVVKEKKRKRNRAGKEAMRNLAPL